MSSFRKHYSTDLKVEIILDILKEEKSLIQLSSECQTHHLMGLQTDKNSLDKSTRFSGWSAKSQVHRLVQGEGPEDPYPFGLQPDSDGGYFGVERFYRIGRNSSPIRKMVIDRQPGTRITANNRVRRLNG